MKLYKKINMHLLLLLKTKNEIFYLAHQMKIEEI